MFFVWEMKLNPCGTVANTSEISDFREVHCMNANTKKGAQSFQRKRSARQFGRYVTAEQHLHAYLHKYCNHYSLDWKRITT